MLLPNWRRSGQERYDQVARPFVAATDDWVQGSVNRPLTLADNVWADKNSRAELNVGTGLIRIGSESSLTLTNVNDNSVQLSLHQGAMNLHVRHLYRGEVYEVDTSNQAFTILKTGDYRFDVDPNADTTLITVWRGEGEATGQGPSVRLKEVEHAQHPIAAGGRGVRELGRLRVRLRSSTGPRHDIFVCRPEQLLSTAAAGRRDRGSNGSATR